MAIILVDQFLSVCKIRHKRFYYKNLARKATLFPRQRVSVQMRIAGNDFPAPSPVRRGRWKIDCQRTRGFSHRPSK